MSCFGSQTSDIVEFNAGGGILVKERLRVGRAVVD